MVEKSKIDRPGAAIIGAVAMVAARVVSPAQALHFIRKTYSAAASRPLAAFETRNRCSCRCYGILHGSASRNDGGTGRCRALDHAHARSP